MIDRIRRFLTLSLALTLTATGPLQATADDKESKPAAAEKDRPADARRGKFPFRGKVAAIDAKAQTITLEGKEKQRVIHVATETRIMRMGKPATFDEAKVGEEVAGQLARDGEKETAVSLRLGPKPEQEAKPKKPRKKKDE